MVGNKQKLNRIGEFNLSLNSQQIENVTNFKYLGMIVDRNLLFHQHVDYK